MYAPISGSVDEADKTPLDTAWRELREETTLDARSLSLFRQGKPYTFADKSIGRKWTIHPFGFILRPDGPGESIIKLDWEHEQYSWFNIDEIEREAEFPGVPRLLESLRRVWFHIDLGDQAAAVLSEGLLQLQNDHVSGARQLAADAITIYRDAISILTTDDCKTFFRNACIAAWHLWKNGRESMGAPILSAMVACLEVVQRRIGAATTMNPDVLQYILDGISIIARDKHHTLSSLSTNLSNFLSDFNPTSPSIKILTLSSSSTISTAVTNFIQKSHIPLDIRILESRPLFEGVSLASRLSSTANAATNPSITVYPDAAAALASKDVDFVLLGADIIDKHGNVSNKTGSLPAILCAKHVSPFCKVIVVAENDKIMPFDPPGHEENDPNELSSAWAQTTRLGTNVTVKNIYFEWVPSHLIDGYFTDYGELTRTDISKWAQGVGERATAMFNYI